ncbi:DUF6519 domain-containing protein [Sorangium sp. KYC3313]|uniref:DUF6519 domain-containing protein n=1 Tax=Sorangium sp. KYC3313 TaxID=3449740 RepID=UPI003F8B5DC4
MNGDLTRSTFDPDDNFTAVRAQQGRVTLDADHNEQVDLQLHDTREGRARLVGGSGAPADDAGFAVTLTGAGVPQLGAGLYLVNGIRVRNRTAFQLGAAQPFLPGANPLPAQDGAWLAYLEVWERPLTAVEEPSIREVALGGPDTTLREQAVWQVRWLRVGDVNTGTCASAAAALEALAQLYNGTLQPRLEPGTVSGPCVVSEAAAFRGLENQLYRIEIHAGNIAADGSLIAQTPTFKWSRDNGAIVASAVALTSLSPVVLQVDRLGPGGAAGFDIGCSVEIRNEAAVLRGEPGILARVDDVRSDALQLTLLGGATVAALQAVLGGSRVVVRRWDGAEAVAISGSFGAIEDGLQVRFDTGARYRTGDTWLIPARTAVLPGTGQQLDWPFTAPDFAVVKSKGPARHRVGLALLDRSGGTWSFRGDCRKLFPPLTSIWSLDIEGGDGQHGRSGEWLPAPLTAVLTRGSAPVPNATLRFRVVTGAGRISTAAPTAPSPVTQIDVVTDSNGEARVYFRLGAGPSPRLAETTWEPAQAQTVEVARIGPAGTPVGAAVTFVAQTLDHFNLHMTGGNGQSGRPGETLEVALRVRVDDGQRPVQNAVVEFSVLNRIFDGTPLNEAQGGNVHDSSPHFVSGERWPNGNVYHTVRTRTDSSGVAQVQWQLGELLSLPTQRVEARLLDGANNPTAQTALFLAQLDVAREITWEPLVPWLAAQLQGAQNWRVQAAIDALAVRVEALAASTNAFDPFVGLDWRSTVDGSLKPVEPRTIVELAQLAALVFRKDLIPPGGDDISLHSGVRVYAELPQESLGSNVKGLAPVVYVMGNFARGESGRWEWTLSSEARSGLAALLPGRQVVPLRVTVVPRWLPGLSPTNSTAVHELVFGIRGSRDERFPVIRDAIDERLRNVR